MALEGTIRFRTSAALLARAERLLTVVNEGKENKQTPSDLGRDAMVLYVEQRERELGLSPLPQEATKQHP